MFGNRRTTGTLLLAGLAAFAYYKYNKLSPEQKRDLAGTIKDKGKSLYDRVIPDNLKNTFAKKESSAVNRFADDTNFTG